MTLEQRLQDALGKQAWLILTLQQQCAQKDEEIAALKAQRPAP